MRYKVIPSSRPAGQPTLTLPLYSIKIKRREGSQPPVRPSSLPSSTLFLPLPLLIYPLVIVLDATVDVMVDVTVDVTESLAPSKFIHMPSLRRDHL